MGFPERLSPKSHGLRIFLCYARNDKGKVKEIYNHLMQLGYDVWWDEKKLVGGNKWEYEILQAIRSADVVLAFLSKMSIDKEGFLQMELKEAFWRAEEKPETAIYLIPIRLEECHVPERLARYNWIDLFDERGWDLLEKSLKIREIQVFGKSKDGLNLVENEDGNFGYEIKSENLKVRTQGESAKTNSNEKKTFWDLLNLFQSSKTISGLTKSVTTILGDLVKTNPGDVELIAASQIKLLTNYYTLVLGQAQRSFTWALIWATIGVLVFIASGIFLFVNQSADIALIGSIGGAIVEVISGINFYLYTKASSQLSDFHVRLDATQKVLLSNAIADKIEGELKQRTRSYLALKFAGVEVTPELLKREMVSLPNLRIKYIAFNPEGSDVSNEFVMVENLGNALADMTDWVLQDNAGHKFKFPMFILKPGTSVSIWTKRGKNNPANLFWGRKRAIWNNSSDCAYLKDDNSKLVDIYYYSNDSAG